MSGGGNLMFETKRLLLKPYKHEFTDRIYPDVSQAEIADTMIAIPHPYSKRIEGITRSY